MDRHVGWSDVSYRHIAKEGKESWVPGATIILREGVTETEQEIFISNEENNKILRGEVLYLTRAEANERMRTLIVPYVHKKWGISEERIQEYQFSRGHAFYTS